MLLYQKHFATLVNILFVVFNYLLQLLFYMCAIYFHYLHTVIEKSFPLKQGIFHGYFILITLIL